jgi:hypothetical protein
MLSYIIPSPAVPNMFWWAYSHITAKCWGLEHKTNSLSSWKVSSSCLEATGITSRLRLTRRPTAIGVVRNPRILQNLNCEIEWIHLLFYSTKKIDQKKKNQLNTKLWNDKQMQKIAEPYLDRWKAAISPLCRSLPAYGNPSIISSLSYLHTYIKQPKNK